MERKDFKKTGGYEANGHGGWVTTDESTTELVGTRAEADLIIDALRVYIAHQSINRALKVETRDGIGSAYYPKQKADPERLLETIVEPNFVKESSSTS